MNDFIDFKITNPILEKRLKRSTRDEIVFRHGHIAITNYNMGDNPRFEKSLSVWDKVAFRYRRVGGYYVEDLHEFRINRAYDLSQLKYHFPHHFVRVDLHSFKSDKCDTQLYTEPRNDFQKVALTFMLSQGQYSNNKKYTQMMIDADTGDGKAQPDDTIIPTPTGLRKLGDLEVGDMVFNLEGKPVTVLAIYPQKGLQETYEVELKDGRKTRCNPDHLWYVSSNHGKAKVLPLSKMIDNYEVPSTDGKHMGHRYSIPIPGPVCYDHQDVPVDPYILGVLIGNGNLGSSALSISSGNLNIPAEVASRIKHPTNFRQYDNYSYYFIKGKKLCKDGKIRNRYVQTKEFLKEIPKLIGTKSGNKFIPDIYKYNSIDIRRELLHGLMDTDGHIGKKRFKPSYTTTSTRLKNDMVELIRSLGYLAYVTEDSRHDKYTSGKCYTITIACPNKDKPSLFYANTKSMRRAIQAAETYKSRRREDMINIISIKKVEPTKQRCIYIDDPLHVYISENYIPTHNTYCGVAACAFLSAKALIFVPISRLTTQWKDSFIKFTNIQADEILIVQGSKMCEKIRNNKYNHIKIFIVIVDTFISYHERFGDDAASEMLKATGAYVKIMDEIHKKMNATNIIEALSNFSMNYYMSASPGRSDRDEDTIFSKLFKNMPRFGSNFKHLEEKHVNIMIMKYKFAPTYTQIKNMYNRMVGLNTKSYERELLNSPLEQRKDFMNSLCALLMWSKKIVGKDNKILILCSTVDGTQKIKDVVDRVFDQDSSAVYHSKIPKDEKEIALTKRIIISTDGSLGTGADIPGIQHIYNIITYSNKIGATQYPGRGRKIDDKTPILYIEFVNFAYNKTADQFLRRKPYLIKKSCAGKLEYFN